MPKKTVREMNIWERLHYSLGAHIFHAVIIFALLLSAAAIGFGFFLYSSSVSRDYRSRTWLLSKTGVHVVDLEAAKKEAEKVLELPVDEIYYNAFNSCEITSLSIPKTMKVIRDNAFWGCSKLKTIVIP